MDDAEIIYVNTQKGLITVLDWTESDEETLILSYGQYPEHFDFDVKTSFFNNNDYNYSSRKIKTKIIVVDGVEYIGIYTKEELPTDTIIRKSSFYYLIKVTLEKTFKC